MKMTMFIIRFAPVGVLGFMLYASAGEGLEVFRALGWYALTVAVALSIHAFITLPLLLKLLARRSPRDYFRAMSPALLKRLRGSFSRHRLRRACSSEGTPAGNLSQSG